MLVDELLPEAKFTDILFYFKDNGIIAIKDLADFDTDNLFFIPGVDDIVVEEATARIRQIDFSSFLENDEAEVQTTTSDNENEEASDTDSSREADEPADIIPIKQEGEFQQYDISAVVVESIELMASLHAQISASPSIIEQWKKEIDANEDKETLSFLVKEIQAINTRNRFTDEQVKVLENTPCEDVLKAARLGATGRACGGLFIRYCHENGLRTIMDLMDFNYDKVDIKGMSRAGVVSCKKTVEDFIVSVASGEYIDSLPPPPNWVECFWGSTDENKRKMIVMAGNKKTLQEIAEVFGITRERVRQILLKLVRILRVPTKEIVNLLTASTDHFSYSDLLDYVNDSDIATACKYILLNTPSYPYVEFADSFYLNLRKDWESIMHGIAEDIIGDGINYLDHIEEVEEALIRSELNCFDFSDFFSYLLSIGYQSYGDFVARKRHTYASICFDAVKRYFADGIKLDSDDSNEDMNRLREILRDKYNYTSLPDNNRTITARLSPMLMLCGRGKYCVPENVVCGLDLIEEIVRYVQESDRDSMYYSELFVAFQGRLLMETNIDNYNGLHGIIKYYYPDEFNYERDALIKLGKIKQVLEDQLAEFILAKGRPVTKTEVREAFPYADEMRIINAISRKSEIIQWSYNMFNHIDNIFITHEEIVVIRQILKKITDANRGYCNERLLYAEVAKEFPEFLTDHKITESLNLFYVAGYYLTPEYRFSRPHIASNLFPHIELTNENVADFFLQNQPQWNYNDLVDLCHKNCLAAFFASFMCTRMEQSYIRIDIDNYVKKDQFIISNEQIEKIGIAVEKNMFSGYIALFAAFTNNGYPQIEYPWNEFLLRSIILLYLPQYKILEPFIKDRRYMRGIVVHSSTPYSTYEDLIIALLEAKGIVKIHEADFGSFLCEHGVLLNNNFPHELSEGNRLKKDGDFFVINEGN